MGRAPARAAPMPAPVKAASEMGVVSTRSENSRSSGSARCMKPSPAKLNA
jgi:hypothetical protein